MDQAQTFGWFNLCSNSVCSTAPMFVPITASNLRCVLYITKTVPNYAHLMWVSIITFCTTRGLLLYNAYNNGMSRLPLSNKFSRNGAAEMDLWLWGKLILQTQYLVSELWPWSSLLNNAKAQNSGPTVTVSQTLRNSLGKFRITACNWMLHEGGPTQSEDQ